MSRGRAAAGRRSRLRIEELEVRQLLSGYAPTSAEQLFLEELNDARANPAAYGASIGLDLSSVAPSQPLAFNPDLIQAALQHSQDMSNRAYFAHTTPEGLDPGARMTQAGFSWNSWGESIAGGSAYPSPGDALAALIIDAGVPDLGHRVQLLAMTSMFQAQNQVGIGVVQGGTGPLVNYYTIDSASSPGVGPFITGVVFNDAASTGKYAIGEGLGGVTISVNGAPIVATWASGGYSIAVAPGTYTVTASGGGLPAPISQVVNVGGSNVRLNFSPADDIYIIKDYQAILGRTPATAEIAPWRPFLQALGPAALASALEHSLEARTRLVDGWYQTFLGRQAHNGEEQGWVHMMLAGAGEQDALAAILASPEFYNRAGTLGNSGTADQQFVEGLYSVLLKRSASATEVNGWLVCLHTAGARAVASGFLRSLEYRADAVAVYYTDILHRQNPPSATEMLAWANSPLDLTAIRADFEASPEFYVNA
ncbi:MAG TPA: DUF4214 domain-containing protein [Gemmataceae bacterium]|nr:DUF4214 domain-containing protein [Gemmataceae bacterium]